MDLSIWFCLAATIIPSFLIGWSIGIDNKKKTNIEIYNYEPKESNIVDLIPDDVFRHDWKE